jgi:pimeloyl-ACP methyl ester carboxylesterase
MATKHGGDNVNKFKKALKLVLSAAVVLLLLYMAGSVLAGAFFIRPEIHEARVLHHSCMADAPENWGFASNDYTRIEFKSLDGLTLQGIFFPVEGSVGMLVLTHGLSDDACAEHMLPLVPQVIDAGYAVFLPTLRNFGASEGDLTSLGNTEWQDVAGAALWLEDNTDEDVPITLLGLSMGGGTTLIAASKGYGDRAIVLAPYTREVPSLTWRMKNQWGVPEALTVLPSTLAVFFEHGLEGFETQPLDYVEEYGIVQPILIIGARNDRTLPPRLLPELQQAIGDNAILVWVDSPHDLVRADPTVTPEVVDLILEFLEEQK